MPANSRVSRVLLFSVLLVISFIALASGQASQKAGKSTPSVETSAAREPSPDASKYVGAETCKTCHEEIYNAWEKTPHWKTTLNKEGGPSKQGCEGCHGPGRGPRGGRRRRNQNIHVQGRFREGNQCPLPELPRRRPAAHERHQLEYTRKTTSVASSCHSPHHAQTKEFLLTKAQPELCYACHLQQKAQFEMPFHHRVNEGPVQCSRLP